MEYALIILFQILGIGFSVGQKVLELDKLSPDDTLNDVMKLFWHKDRVTILMSILVLVFNLTVHFTIEEYAPQLLDGEYHMLWSFGIALLLGFTGQKLIYKALGKAEGIVNKKIEDAK